MIEDTVDCSILILTYKGKKHLELLLPTVQIAIENSPEYKLEVFILDNAKDADTEDFVNKNFSQFKIIGRENNYLFSYNAFVSSIESKSILILNDDLKLSTNIFNDSLPLFSDENLFAISCLFKDWGRNNIQLSWSNINFSKGWMRILPKKEKISANLYTFYACGGAAFYRTEMFNELKGFDPIYYPAYYEDTDLSHRAWHRGWKIIAHSTAFVEHRIGGSWKDSKQEKDLLILQQRNKIIGMLINCDYPGFLFWFFVLLPYRLIYSFLFQKITFIAFIKALSKLNLTMAKRKTVLRKKEDRDIKKLFGKEYQFKNKV